MVPLAGLEPARYRYRGILSFRGGKATNTSQRKLEVNKTTIKSRKIKIPKLLDTKKVLFVCPHGYLLNLNKKGKSEGHRRDIPDYPLVLANERDSITTHIVAYFSAIDKIYSWRKTLNENTSTL